MIGVLTKLLDYCYIVQYMDVQENKKILLDIEHGRICECGKTNINCLTAKEWLKNQIGVWQFTYEKRDVRA